MRFYNFSMRALHIHAYFGRLPGHTGQQSSLESMLDAASHAQKDDTRIGVIFHRAI